MKIINACIGRNSPVIRMYAGQPKRLCYIVKSACCDETDVVNNGIIPLYLPNNTIPNTYPLSNNVTYRIYNDTYDYVGLSTISNNKFKIMVPALSAGYYYVEVTGYGTKNRIMLNVL